MMALQLSQNALKVMRMPASSLLPLPATQHLVKTMPLEYQGLIVGFFDLLVLLALPKLLNTCKKKKLERSAATDG